jgi:carbon storage regulator
MLVLSRRPGEEIVVNNNIRITVVSVKGDRVRLGITAPNDVPVDRAEVHARRMQFFDVPVSALTGGDSAVSLGANLESIDPASDTVVH